MGKDSRRSYFLKTNSTDKPAPGHYQPTHGVIGKDAPGFGFGSSERAKLRPDNTPGPGHYKLPMKVADTPSYAIPNKKDEHKFV